MCVALPQMEHVFAVWRQRDTVLPFILTVPTLTTKDDAVPSPSYPVYSPDPVIYNGYPCLPKNLLNKHPVDLLVIEQSSD